MSYEHEKMIVESLSSLYPMQKFEEEAIDAILDALPHWIPCSERLPSESGPYLTTYTGFMADRDVCILAFIKDGEESRWACSGEVHAWMKHPDPYEG